MSKEERAYQLCKAYREILRERGVKKLWTLVPPTSADIAEAKRRVEAMR